MSWPFSVATSIRVLIAQLAILTSCTAYASLPEDYDRTPSTAFQDYLDMRFGQLFGAADATGRLLRRAESLHTELLIESANV